MSGFAALMALSASQTRESQHAVQSALAQRQRNAELQRKKQEEQERKERELAAKLRQQHFENQKRELLKQQKLEQEERAMELSRQRREQEQRDALRYGPKKAKSHSSGDTPPRWPTSNGHAKEQVRKRRMPSEDDEGSSRGSPRLVLTREEKRERKIQAELRRDIFPKRSTTSNGYSKADKRLPGGAIDAPASPMAPADSGSSTLSVKERIAAIPNTLTKLNVVKRDTRTIDEILQDRAKAKGDARVLNGDEAREFSDWFGTSKKKELLKKELLKKATERPTVSAPGSGAASPSLSNNSLHGPSTPPIVKTNAHRPSSSSTTAKTSASTSKPSGLKATNIPKSSNLHNAPASKSRAPPLSASTSRSSYPSSASSKKRPRSPSLSASPPPRAPKRRALSPSPSHNSLSAEIWKMFGKDRTAYTQMDVLSDDEDMEADALGLESEELRSARVAKKEDQEAFEAERRHEDEKRRRKKEREMREKRGY